jgi:8-oxo-dGTP diphosphatase
MKVTDKMWSRLPSEIQELVRETDVPVKVTHVEEVEEDVFPSESVIVTGVAERDGDALFVKSSKEGRGWEFPGGRSEPGESLRESVDREVTEETGYAVEGSLPKLVLMWVLPDRTVTQVVFKVEVAEKQQESDGEVEEVAWKASVPDDMTFSDGGSQTHEVILEEIQSGRERSWREYVPEGGDSQRLAAAGVVAAGVIAGAVKKARD